MTIEAPRPSTAIVCSHCGDELLLGEPMHWFPDRVGYVWHDACARRLGLVEAIDDKPKKRARRTSRTASPSDPL